MENDRTQFPFPYKPYDIQEQFMRALYRTLDQGKVGIFESPTGTVRLVDLKKPFAVVLVRLNLNIFVSNTSGQVFESNLRSSELAHRL